jgi:hypothetical protein
MSRKPVGELVGLVGVIGSLVFVGLEVRQNTLAARAAAYQDMGSMISGTWMLGAEDPELAALTLRFFEEEDAEFTPIEEARLISQTVGAFRQYETVWRQVQLGLLDPEVLGYFGWGDPGSIISGNTKKLWPRIRQYMTPDFRAFLEGASEPVKD